jgi:Cdc6-like AAA superfamily ATPase
MFSQGKNCKLSPDLRFLIDKFLDDISEGGWKSKLEDQILDIQKKIEGKETLNNEDFAELIFIAYEWMGHECDSDSFKFYECICDALRPMTLDDSDEVTNLNRAFIKYVQFYDNFDSLISDYDTRKESFSHLLYDQGYKSGDVKNMNFIIEILDNGSNYYATLDNRESELEWLKKTRQDVHELSIISSMDRFHRVIIHIDDMLMDKINTLSMHSDLRVNVEGIDFDGTNYIETSEIWCADTENTALRGCVTNAGSVIASDISVQIEINGSLFKTLHVDYIYSHERIPFRLSLRKDLERENKIEWRVKISGNDLDPIISSGEIHINHVDTGWDVIANVDPYLNPDNNVDDEFFKGRKNELAQLSSLYDESRSANTYPSLLVMGLMRNGKTSLVKRFRSILSHYRNIKTFYIDGNECKNDPRDAFVRKVIKRVNADKEVNTNDKKAFVETWHSSMTEQEWIQMLPDFYNALSELYGRKVIVFLDEMESIFFANGFQDEDQRLAFMGTIRAMIQNYRDSISFVLIGSNMLLTTFLDKKVKTQLFQNLGRIPVGRMSESEIATIYTDYNNSSPIRFSKTAMDEIYKYTGGQVWYTKIIAYNTLLGVIEKERVRKKEVLPADVALVVERLVIGELGSEKINLFESSFGDDRTQILAAMSRLMKDKKQSVSINDIMTEMERDPIKDGSVNQDNIVGYLKSLKEMDVVENDKLKQDAYTFSTELNRIICTRRSSIHKFVVVKEA